MIYLVGENIDKTRAHYQAASGKLVQLIRGVYADAGGDIDADVLRHGVRIATYLYPRTYLSSASAVLLAPDASGRLFISGPRNQRTRIRSLEIIQNRAPDHPSTAPAVIDDGMGELKIYVSGIRQRLLESFRIRSEHAAAMDDTMRRDIATRLLQEYGSPPEAADAVWSLARDNGWVKEAATAERFLNKQPTVTAVRNEAAFVLHVAWHGTPIGDLLHDGFEWEWKPLNSFNMPLVQQRIPGQLPPFILSLLPEGWLERVLKSPDQRSMLRAGHRYMSNLTISENTSDLGDMPADILAGRLADFSHDGLFTGRYAGPGRDHIHKRFEENLAELYRHSQTPRLSGIQIKAPMYLDGDGTLWPATDKPFTHILKPAGTSGFEALPVVEYMAMALARHAGFDVPAVALMTMPDELPPALLVERFDIRLNEADQRLLALEDLCSVLDLPPEAKYDGTIERAARAIRPLSTSPEEDLQILIQRALFAWLIADGDMHLKNMALLKTAVPGVGSFITVRMAPVYDAVTTRVFPDLQNDRMALKVNGKDDRLRRDDFIRAATTAGLAVTPTGRAIDATLEGLNRGLGLAAMPEGIILTDDLQLRIDQQRVFVSERLTTFT